MKYLRGMYTLLTLRNSQWDDYRLRLWLRLSFLPKHGHRLGVMLKLPLTNTVIDAYTREIGPTKLKSKELYMNDAYN